jgi:serine/threonine protein kinase
MSKVSNSNSTYLLSSTNQQIKSDWQSIQHSFPLIYNKLSVFQKDNSNMLKNTLINNYISNSPPKAKLAMPEKKVSINDYQILDTLGKGSCGFVKLAKRKSDGKNVIIKYVVKSLVLDGCWTREDNVKIPTEIHILKYITENFPHPYVLRLLNTWEDNYYYYLEFDSQNSIDLFECIDNRRFTTEAQVKKIFYRIVQGVQHLHHINIVHRDIKDENILIRDDDTVEIIDFGSSAYVKEGKKFDKFCGTGGYAAPEVLSGQKYDGPPQDIWSLGILLYTMIYGSNPFRTLDQIITSEVQFPVIVSSGSHDLMCQMLNRDFQKRPNIDEVINHPWFNDLSEEDKQIPKNRQIHIENDNKETEINKVEIITKEEIEKNKKTENPNKNISKISGEEEEDITEMDNISVEILTPMENEKEIEIIKTEEDENELTSTTLNEELMKKLDLHSISSEECDIKSDSTLVD